METLKGMRRLHVRPNATLYTGFTEFMYQWYVLYIYVLEIILYTISCIKKKNGIYIRLNVGDQNTTYVFAIKGIDVLNLSSSLQ